MSSVFYYSDGIILNYRDRRKILHRVNAPSVEFSNGDRFWHRYGHLHREDGPAVSWHNGDTYWFMHGFRIEFLSREQLETYMNLTGTTIALLLIDPDEVLRDSAIKYNKE